MNVLIHIPTALRPYVGGRPAVEVAGSTAGEALDDLTRLYPELHKHLRGEDGKLRSFVNIYLNDDDIRHLQKEQTLLKANDSLIIVPSIAGGARG